MLGFLIGLIDPISKITKAIADAKIAATNATTEQARIAAEERVKILEARASVLSSEANRSAVNLYVRAFLAAPVGIFLWKVFVYDKALGQWTKGRTDGLDPNLWAVVMIVLTFYFVYETVQAYRR